MGQLFDAAGFVPLASGWPGEPPAVVAVRTEPQAVADRGIDRVVAHYADLIDSLSDAPILVDHSFGGLIV